MTPTKIDNIIDEAEKHDQAYAKQCSIVFNLHFDLVDGVDIKDCIINLNQDYRRENKYDSWNDSECFWTIMTKEIDKNVSEMVMTVKFKRIACHLHFLFGLVSVIPNLIKIFPEETLILQFLLEFADSLIWQVKSDDGEEGRCGDAGHQIVLAKNTLRLEWEWNNDEQSK